MQKANNQRKTIKKVKSFLDAEVKPLHFLNNPKHVVGGFVSALLFISIINIGINQPRLNNISGPLAKANSVDVQTPEDPPTGGRMEGVGTHFEVTGSRYLNIAVDATNSIKVSLESIPETILMNIKAESPDIVSTSVTLSGFLPLTAYHKYEDNYLNHEIFTSDNSGKYAYTQDLTSPHLVYFQPRPSTKIITTASGGDCNLIGNWNESTKTCVLSQNVNESIQISGDGITLDGNGYSLTGTNTGFGITLSPYRTNATIKNLNINKFSYGIYANTSGGSVIQDNILSNNFTGIVLTGSSDNTIERNTLRYNYGGIVASSESKNNIIKNNEISYSQGTGLDIYNSSDNNIISGNNIGKGRWGITIRTSINNLVDSNNLIANGTGFTLAYPTTSSNKIVNNLNKDNTNNISIRMYNSAHGNIVYNNYFNNPPYFDDSTPYNNIWNFEKTSGVNIIGGPYIGGNFWALKNGGGFSETCSDSDLDGICDTSYVVSAGGIPVLADNLPLAKPDTAPPVTSIDIAGTNGNNSWYVSGVIITLSAADNLNGSGVAKTEYSFDNASWNTYSSPVAFGDEGASTIYYRSVDNAGNIELVQTASFKIDKSAPAISGSAVVLPNANNWYNQDVTIRFNCNDMISGAVNSVIDTVINTEGANQSASGTCTDNAGNVSAPLIIDGINIDKTSPLVSVVKSPNANSQGWNNEPVSVTFTASDAISGIDGDSARIVIFNNEGQGQTASHNFTDKAGNVSNASASGINLDFTPPALSGGATLPPNSHNWYNTDVTINFTGSDVLSGLADVSPSITLTFEGSNQEANGRAEDFAGNVVNFKVTGINIDKTPPVISAAPQSSPNSNNWYNKDITIKFSGSDDLSGIGSITPDIIISQEGFGLSAFGTAIDKAGNAANGEVSGINLDKTPPVVSGAALNSPNGNGWYRDNAIIHFEASDSLSGVNEVTPDIVVSQEGEAQTARGEALDKAGNGADFTVSGINIDKTSPVTEAVLSGNSGNTCDTSDTSVLLNGNDNLSGIAGTFYNLDNAGWFSYISKIFVADEGQHILKYNSQDKADNYENAKEVSFSVDKTPAEAVIKFDPVSKDIKVYNTKTGDEMPYTVISRNIRDEDEEDEEHKRGWNLRRYKITNCGNNYTILTLKHKKAGKESKIKIVSLQINNGPKKTFKSTGAKAEYSTDKNGSINQLEQEIEAEKLFDIEAKYSAKKNNTEIKLKLAGQKEKKETKQGMVILGLSTDEGSFKYEY